jgi:integrase
MLAAILEGAVKDKRISTNPARDVKLPRKKKGTRAYLSHQQVERLARAAKYPDLIRFLSYTGLRWGEATGLRVKHIDQVSRRIRIEENAVSVHGQIVIGTPKTHERRAVVFPPFLDQAISRACKGKSSEDLVWGDGLKHLRSGDLRRGWFVAAVARVRAEDEILAAEARASGNAEPNMMPKLTPHDLRHTAASLAISAGANVKAVQRMLGHASAAMTLDTYSDLYEDDLESVAVALDSARRLRLEQ